MPDLASIRIPPPHEHRRDSLILALQALLHWHGRDVAYDNLIAATAVGAMLVFTDRDPCPARWSDFGRDAFLVESAAPYGLSLRDLHPPDAVPLPAGRTGRPPLEFELHWRDSYVPLIETALAHRQPVLAWMGWPAPHETQWGIITELNARTRTCAGVVAGVPQSVALERAAVQAYVAQEFASADAPRDDGARVAARWLRVLRNELPPTFDVQSGPAALDRLRARLNDRDICPIHKSDSWQCLARLSDTIASRRRAAAAGLAGAGQPVLAAALAASIAAIESLHPSPALRETWTSSPTRRALMDAIERIRTADAQLIDALERRP